MNQLREDRLFKKRLYYLKNIDYSRQQKRQFYLQNAELLKQRTKNYRIANLEKVKEKNRIYHKRVKINLMNLLGGIKCRNCGITDMRVLQFDHINGNGKKERKKFKCHSTLQLYYYKLPHLAKQNLQVLCANCNWIKRHERKEV